MRKHQRGHIGSDGPGSDEEFDAADLLIDAVLLAMIFGLCYLLWSVIHG